MREQPQLETEAAAQLFDNWFDPIEAGLRDRAREFLQAMLEGELDQVLDEQGRWYTAIIRPLLARAGVHLFLEDNRLGQGLGLRRDNDDR
jgi:hypothetical protein